MNQGRPGRPSGSRKARSTRVRASLTRASRARGDAVAARQVVGRAVERGGLRLEAADAPRPGRAAPRTSSGGLPRPGLDRAGLALDHPPQVVDVLAERLAVGDEPERDDLGRRGPHDEHRVEPRGRRVGEELGVAELLHPGEVVVDRVIDAVPPAEADVERRDAQVVEERRVVRARAERVHLGREPRRPGREAVAGSPLRGRVGEVERARRLAQARAACSSQTWRSVPARADVGDRRRRRRAPGRGARGRRRASRSGPETAESTLSSSTAFSSSSSACSSAHSVEPTRPYSSASQLA